MESTRGYLDMELLRFSTAGSVDDGKSTLIGRLLYDSKSIFEDQLEAVEAASKSHGIYPYQCQGWRQHGEQEL